MNAPVDAVVLPIGPGDTNVAPPNVDALIVPEPVNPKLAPVPTSMAAAVLVPLRIALNAAELAPQPPPESTSNPAVPLN